MILSDRQIRKLSLDQGMHAMIEPFAENRIRHGVISFGLSSYGYDARLANEFLVFSDHIETVIDPKKFHQDALVSHTGDTCIVPPNGFILGRTLEWFRIPRDILVICLGKSTYARCGLIVNVTPLEPEWEGNVTIEISNTTSMPAKVYANEGICQFIFLQGNEPCETSYADKAGKYQGQRGITLPLVR